MKTLVFDTETTGFANFGAPHDARLQPYIVQLAAILYDHRKVVSQMCAIITPIGADGIVSIPDKASAIHGITNEFVAEVGIPMNAALILFGQLAMRADRIVAHNIPFDRIVVEAEFRRWREERGDEQCTPPWADKPHICTMRTATPICQLPSPRGGYKWPKLVEAHKHFTGDEFDGAHDALADVQACARVLWALEDGEHQLVEIAA